MSHVAIVGATGFVGAALHHELERRGHRVSPLRAPRLQALTPVSPPEVQRLHASEIESLAESLRDTDVLVNCAGMSDSGCRAGPDLYGAHAFLPGVVGAAASRVRLARYIHLSSAAVQGRRQPLDDTLEYDLGSPYARSKAWGEYYALSLGPRHGTTCYRPPGVHHMSRARTQQIARLAASPFAFVAGDGSAPAPQVTLDQVTNLLTLLCLTERVLPPVVMHPWEGQSVTAFLQGLSGRSPRHVPEAPVRALVSTLIRLGRLDPRCVAWGRRLEVMTLGQSISSEVAEWTRSER